MVSTISMGVWIFHVRALSRRFAGWRALRAFVRCNEVRVDCCGLLSSLPRISWIFVSGYERG